MTAAGFAVRGPATIELLAQILQAPLTSLPKPHYPKGLARIRRHDTMYFMEDHHGRETAMSHRVWQVLHVVATIAVPWAFAGYYLRSHPSSIIDVAHSVADYHVKAAIAAGVLLASTVLLRLFGRSVAATGPFAAMWAIAMAFAISQAREYGGEFHCQVELCIPDFGLFITAVPFAVVVSFAVIGSALINHALRKNNRASPMTLQ